MHRPTDDVRIESLRPLLPPAILLEEVAIDADGQQVVADARTQISQILHGTDDRMLVVVGPCSIHDRAAALEYGQRLKRLADRLANDLLIVMRSYFEKPRTTVGWKGLINDPNLDGSFQINQGLRIARTLLKELTELGMPVGTEFLDPVTPQYVADLVAWGAVGARTAESQVHREMASGMSMPIGFKNATSGDVQPAVDAVRASQHKHHFLGATKQGLSAIVATRGNPDGHVILRGGHGTPNYHASDIAAAVDQLHSAALSPRVMVDCSHDNSGKDHTRQPAVATNIAHQISTGSDSISGVMIESFLVEGRQKLDAQQPLVYGQSITDACIGWETTERLLEVLAKAVASRRSTACNTSTGPS